MYYLTNWTEKEFAPSGIRRSWKGYPFEALNRLADKGNLCGQKRPGRSKSVYLSPEGIEKAKELEGKYL